MRVQGAPLRRGLATILAAGMTGGVFGGGIGAQAAEWTVAPRIEGTQTFTDNAESDDEDRDADAITTVTGGVSVRGTGARLNLNLDYDLSFDQFWRTGGQSGYRQDGLGDLTAELVEDFFFFDARGQISQEDVLTSGATTATRRNTSDNQAVVINTLVSPYFRNRFGGFAESELRYELDTVLFRDADRGNAGGLTPGDETTHEVSVELNSGTDFTVLGWSLSGSALRTDDDFDRDTGQGSLSYRINRYIQLLGTGGYEEINDDDIQDDRDGVFWTGGVRLTPGPRTELRVEYGQRFDDNIWSGDFTYRFSSRTILNASYGEDILTGQQVLSDRLGRFIRDDQGNLVDPATGLAPDPNDPLLDLTDDAFRQRQFTVALSGSRGRNTFNLSGFYTERKFDVDTSDDDETVGGALRLSRQVRPNAIAGLEGSYSDVSGDDDEDSQTIRATAFLDYTLTESLTGTVSYNFLRRARDNDGNITENAVLVSLRKDF